MDNTCAFVYLCTYVFLTGNYGNKLDENSPAQSSTTPPSNPIYDGNAYYYLPWLDQKPCVVVRVLCLSIDFECTYSSTLKQL